MQICGTTVGSARAQAFAQFVGTLRTGKQTFQQRAQVEAGAADHDRKMAALRDLADRRACLPGILAGREGFAGIGNINQVMRNARAIFARRLGGPDFKVAIHSNRIAADDLSGESVRRARWRAQICRNAVGPRMTSSRGSGECGSIQRAPQGMVLPKRTNAMIRISSAITSNPTSFTRSRDFWRSYHSGVLECGSRADGRFGVHSAILLAGLLHIALLAGCNRSGSARPDTVREIRRAAAQRDSRR